MALVGVIAGGPGDVMLRVERRFTGSIGSLRPVDCRREGEPPAPALSVDVLEDGLRPVGGRRFRHWRVGCPNGRAQEHRAWVLPVSQVAIYEQVADGHPENVDVVTTADVS
ncbi:MAG: hypothetical protein LC792_16535 [Actinobacteria bacterium]|nr:hypothetical protein [Actinomycetota bacterium]